jgi:hypothetical protein
VLTAIDFAERRIESKSVDRLIQQLKSMNFLLRPYLSFSRSELELPLPSQMQVDFAFFGLFA